MCASGSQNQESPNFLCKPFSINLCSQDVGCGSFIPQIPFLTDIETIVMNHLPNAPNNFHHFIAGCLSFFIEEPYFILNLKPAEFKRQILYNCSKTNVYDGKDLFLYFTENFKENKIRFDANQFCKLVQRIDNDVYDGQLLHISCSFKAGNRLFVIFWILHIFTLTNHITILQQLGQELQPKWKLVLKKGIWYNIDFQILLEKFNYNYQHRKPKKVNK